jgi:hypothetical protein
MTAPPRLGIALVLACLAATAARLPARDEPLGSTSANDPTDGLVQALHDDNALVRKRAAIALGRLGPAAHAAVGALEKALKDSDPDVRAAAAAALEKVDVRASLGTLVGRLHDPAAPAQARRDACKELAERFWREPKATQALESALTDPVVKLDAARALDAIDQHGRAAEPRGTTPAPAAVAGHTALVRGLPNLLLRRGPSEADWHRLPAEGGDIHEGDTLVALPGYRSHVSFDSGVGLLLWGNLVDFLDVPLLESKVALGAADGADLDFTLLRGRVLLSNQKKAGPARVRVHFGGPTAKPAETWEVTLQEPGTEVILDLLGHYPQGADFRLQDPVPPRAEFYLVVSRGEAGVKAGSSTYEMRAPPAGPSLMSWDNYGGGVHAPTPVAPTLTFWNKALPQTQAAQDALEALALLLKQSSDRPIRTTLEETLKSDRASSRALAVYCLGALDVLAPVIGVLDSGSPRDEGLRLVAIMELRHWIGARADHDRELYQELISDRHYTPGQAGTVLELLHDFPADQLKEPQFWQALIGYLRASRPAIRNLAYWHLYRHVPQGRGPKFDPSGDERQREAAYQAWKMLIPDGKLPPPAPTR